MEKSNDAFIMDDHDAGLFRVNRRAFTDPECLEDERRESSTSAGSTSVTSRRCRTRATIVREPFVAVP